MPYGAPNSMAGTMTGKLGAEVVLEAAPHDATFGAIQVEITQAGGQSQSCNACW